MRRALWTVAAVFAIALAASACGGDDDDAPKAPSVDPETGLLTASTEAPPPEALTPEPTRPGRLPTPTPVPAGRPPVPTPTPLRPTPTVAALGTNGCFQAFRTGDSVRTLTSGGLKRSYRLHVPPTYDNASPMPVVLNFHGYAQSAAQQERYSGLNGTANLRGFIVVTPDGAGSPLGWNIVGVYDENGVDDVQFVRELMVSLSKVLCLDQNRVFATGHSNGGEMASQLACLAPDLVAAVAPVSGAVWQDCPGRPVPIVAFQGTADQNVFYEWSAAAMDAWGWHNGCGGSSPVAKVSAHVSRRNWQKCKADVVFYVVDGGGHTWPGSTVIGGAGPVTTEISANNLMWAFFASHPKR